MTIKKKMTNEALTKHFDNPFDLVNHAIHLAKNFVGFEPETVDTTTRNAAVIILKKIQGEKEMEQQSQTLLEVEHQNDLNNNSDLPDPLLQAI